MIMRIPSVVLSAGLIINSVDVCAADIPEGFESHFKLKKSDFKFRNLDGSFSEPIPVLSSFNTIKLDGDNKQSIKSVFNYLDKNSIKKSYQQDIVNTLIAGVDDTAKCLGKIDDCQLYPETYEIVQNYNDQQIYLFVSPNLLGLSNDTSTAYHSSESKSNALINSFDLYLSDYSDRDTVLSLNDETILGLPYGYVKTDFNINNNDDNNYTLYEAAYHLDVDAYAVKLGHFEYDPAINSTDYLNDTARLSQNSITIGSSEKLLVGGQNSNKVLSFYAPSAATVQVLRNERIVYQENVAAGQNSISYSKLPTGRYEATVRVTSNGQEINTQTFQVYNATNDNLSAGSVDYVLSAGMFAESYFDDDNKRIADIEGEAYGKGLINYQATPSLQLGAGTLFSEDGNMYTAGGNYSLLETGLVAEAVHRQFNHASHTAMNLGLPIISVSYETLDNKQGDPVATHMYGYSDYSRWSLNSSYAFGGGRSMYAIYTKSEETLLDLTGSASDSEQDNILVSVGYTTPSILDSRLSVNFDYSDADKSKTISLLWSVPLSDTLEATMSGSSNTETVNQLRTSVRKSDLIDTDVLNASLDVANTYNRDMEEIYQEAIFSSNGNSDYARLNLQAYASSRDSTKGITAGLSSTQIVTTEGIHITKDKSSSYTLIDIEDLSRETNSDVENRAEEKGYFSLNKDGKNNSKYVIYDDEKIVPLRSYHEYEAKFDSQSVDLYNSGDSEVTLYTHPGAVSYLQPKVSRVVSFVSAFNNISDQPVTSIKCKGVGCLEVNEMTDGVYRVTVLEGLDFELVSNHDQCLLPYEFRSTSQLNFGQNYCLPIADADEIQQIEFKKENLNAFFLGAYEASPQLQKSIQRLKSYGYKIIQKNVGNYKAVYIAHKSKDMINMLAQHQQEIENIKLLAKQLYKTNAITYPVANVY